MIKLVVIADDFTGALDTAVQFAKRGIKTLVTADATVDLASFDEEIEVLTIDIESRHLNSEAAYARVQNTVAFAMSLSPQCIYLKTDSTLRGPIGAEFAALLDETKSGALMFIPAFPKNGRTTKNGIQYVDGIPLSDTIFANDHINPVVVSRVKAVISSGTNKKVVEVPFSEKHTEISLEGSPDGVIYVFDAETDEHLSKIGENLFRQGKCGVLSGCAGFAEILPDIFELRQHPIERSKTPGNVLIVVGSANQISLQQISLGELYGFELYSLSPEEKIGTTEECDAKRTALLNKAKESLMDSGKVIVATLTSKDDIDITNTYGEQVGIPADQIPALTANNIASITKELIGNVPIDNLVIFGGDTLMAIMDAIACKGIIPYEEIAPGVVASKILGDKNNFTLVTKAGSFGEKDIISKIYHYLQSSENPYPA
ncbi:MAG: four-carbon acid sugar kinase family protein [Clostridiales bacterium]|nr:four-carbon acid sugar kinase family protein [Clostridiales bacterium]